MEGGKCSPMSEAENKLAARRFLEEVPKAGAPDHAQRQELKLKG